MRERKLSDLEFSGFYGDLEKLEESLTAVEEVGDITEGSAEVVRDVRYVLDLLKAGRLDEVQQIFSSHNLQAECRNCHRLYDVIDSPGGDDYCSEECSDADERHQRTISIDPED